MYKPVHQMWPWHFCCNCDTGHSNGGVGLINNSLILIFSKHFWIILVHGQGVNLVIDVTDYYWWLIGLPFPILIVSITHVCNWLSLEQEVKLFNKDICVCKEFNTSINVLLKKIHYIQNFAYSCMDSKYCHICTRIKKNL